MSYNPKSLFNNIQKREQENAANGGNSGGFSNPLIFKPKVGTTYAVRLLWLPPAEGYDREYPMINSYIHRIWDENVTSGSKDVRVVCPTSQYMMGETSAAFKKCPICTAASEFYKKGQEGSESAKEMYSKFRRTCVGYVPVYIVNGPEEDIHQVKILQYSKQFKDFFDSKIFGIKKQNKNSDEMTDNILDEEAIGLEAFMYYDETVDEIVTKGYNLVINTSTKKMIINGKTVDMPQYTLDFTRKASNIVEIDDIDLQSEEGIKYFNSLNESILNFDKDFYIKSNDAELQEFKMNYITKETVDESIESEDVTDKPVLKLPKKEAVVTKKPVVEEPSISDASEEIPMTETGEIDIDKLCEGLED